MRRAARAPAPGRLRANAVCSESSTPQDLEAVYATPPCLQLASSAAVGHGADALGVHASPAAAGTANANIALEPFPVAFEGEHPPTRHRRRRRQCGRCHSHSHSHSHSEEKGGR
jgi:hypothetical protein